MHKKCFSFTFFFFFELTEASVCDFWLDITYLGEASFSASLKASSKWQQMELDLGLIVREVRAEGVWFQF